MNSVEGNLAIAALNYYTMLQKPAYDTNLI
jgi:hypothetical protein